ncbi:MAG: SHOCT domain-containing protein [Chloroflexota bacterium]
MSGDEEARAGVPVRAVLLAAAAYGVGAACNVLVFLAMRAVMGVGGACADGGPYVSAQPCPDGTAAAMGIGIPVMTLSWFMATYYGSKVGGIWGSAVLIGWTALFGSLGWNFLDAGLFNASSDYGIEWGAVVCGVIFWVMAAGGLLVLIGSTRMSSGRSRSRGSSASTGAAGSATPLRMVDPSALAAAHRPVAGHHPAAAAPSSPAAAERRELAAIAADFGAAVDHAAAQTPVAPPARRPEDAAGSTVDSGPGADGAADKEFSEGTQALLDRLERLGDMRDRGLLEPAEYETAKEAIMHELEARS